MQLNAPHIRAEEVGLPLPGPRDPPTQPPASSWDLTPAGVEIKLPHRKKQRLKALTSNLRWKTQWLRRRGKIIESIKQGTIHVSYNVESVG